MADYFGPPSPPFQQIPVHPEYFAPRTYMIASIAISGIQASVTTDDPNDYVIGQLVRFHIPKGWGMNQLNEQSGYITEINSSNNFIVNINILNYDAFVVPGSPFDFQTAQVSAIGDKNLATSGLTISGAFRNVSA